MTTVVNLFGGPGCGKSTTAAAVFAQLKARGVVCELVPEWVKGWAWEQRPVDVFDQPYILAKQLKAESRLYGKVDFIITDCPLLLVPIYEEYLFQSTHTNLLTLGMLAQAQRRNVVHRNFLLKRMKPYVQAGRWQTANEAAHVDAIIENWMRRADMKFEAYDETRPIEEIVGWCINTKLGVTNVTGA